MAVLVQARFQLSCSLCAQTYGACIQCAGSRQCFAAFHPTCAAREGLRMVRLNLEMGRSLHLLQKGQFSSQILENSL